MNIKTEYSPFMKKFRLYILLCLFCAIAHKQADGQQHDSPPADTSTVLSPVVVSAEKPNANVVRPEMSVEKLDIKQIKLIPALFGEVDLIKAIQLLPGVQAASEGSSGFSVRGGSPDQNLILFDDALVYNASHLMGFFSVFNNEAVDDITLYKGDIPASYGGRLSSLLDVQGKTGRDKWAFNAGIGLIASRITLEGPVHDNASLLLAARRTYADVFFPLLPDAGARSATLYFYDLNLKYHWRIDRKNQLSLTAYYGNDKFGNGDMIMAFGNRTGTLRWKHFINEQWTMQAELLGSGYDYNMAATMPAFLGEWISGIYGLGGRIDFTYRDVDNTFRFGWNSDYKWFSPGGGEATVEEQNYTMQMDKKYAWENAIYFTHQHRLFEKLTLKYGLRLTRFDNLGATNEYRVNENYELIDTIGIASGKFYHHTWGVEPRVGLTFALNDGFSLKASYARTVQFLHLLSMSTAGSPLDVWVPSNLTIKPETANQYAVGAFANFMDNTLETSLEIYYKQLGNIVDFKDHAQVIGNNIIESEIRNGTGENYGVELMLRKNEGKLTGWVSYTWSRAFRTVPTINKGMPYSSPFDRPHNINVVLTYPLSSRITASLNWIYVSGQPVTFPEARYAFGDDYIPVYSARNTYRMPDYHRLDASLDILLGKQYPSKRWQHSLNVSVYNLYGRKNPWTINFKTDTDNTQYAEMTYLFSIVPSVTYTISFQ